MTTPKKPTGRVPLEAIRSMTIPRLPAPILAAFAQIEDLTCTVSDAMDNLGLRGAIAASWIRSDASRAPRVSPAADLECFLNITCHLVPRIPAAHWARDVRDTHRRQRTAAE